MKDSLERNRDELLDEGERHFYDGDYERALGIFDEAIANDEDDAEAHYLRGRALFYLGKDEEAGEAYDRALDLDGQFVPALIHKAELLVRAHGWAGEALELVAEAEELELTKVDKLEASFVRGIALMEQGDYHRALESLNRAVRGDADWTEALRERGICRFCLWRFEDARRDLARCVEKDPNDPEASYSLAMCLERLGNLAEAEAAYAGAARLNPEHFHVPTRMSKQEFEGVVEEAIAALPEEFRIRFDNLSFAVEDFPPRDGDVLPDTFGLCVGSTLPERAHDAIALLPCRILIFQKNLERLGSDRDTLKDEIAKTVMHEVGHFFGMSEEDMVRLQIH